MIEKIKETIWFEKSNEELPEGIYPGMMQTKIYNAMQAYADQEVKKAIEKAYCIGYINGAGEYGSVVDPIADGKLKEAFSRYLQSIT